MAGIGKKLCIYFIFIWMIVMSGCKSVREPDLYGTYVAEGAIFSGKATLVLDPNGKYYQQIIFTADTKTITQQGNWRYDSKNKEVVLVNAIHSIANPGTYSKLPHPEEFNAPFPGDVRYEVNRYSPWFCKWGRIKIGSYEYILYIKEKSFMK